MKTNKFLIFSLVLIFLGIVDTAYLTWEHYAQIIPPCPTHSILGSFVDCGRVLQSPYAQVLGIPLALIGLGYYLFLLLVLFKARRFLRVITAFGLGVSLSLLYVQIFILHAICLYCTFSGAINLLLFIIS